jgi:hypothetical protein
MISIIISSANPDLLEKITQNIEDSIGVPYEVISFDNSNGSSGLCKLYNEGTTKAKYDILCFMHEDIEIKTASWGKIVIDYFNKDPHLGLVGIAGSSYKSAIPSGWHSFAFESKINYINIIQNSKRNPGVDIHDYSNPKNEKLSQVVCLDGVWLCTPKQVALEFPFDAETLRGFHVYDIDFSLSVNQKYKVAVTFEILMKHFSEGNYTNAWLKDTIKIHNKWMSLLPLGVEILSKKDAAMIEKKAFRHLIKKHKRHLSFIDSFKILNQSKIWKLNFPTHLHLCLTLVKLYFISNFQRERNTSK